MELSELQRLKQVEDENRRLKHIVAGQTLDIQALMLGKNENWSGRLDTNQRPSAPKPEWAFSRTAPVFKRRNHWPFRELCCALIVLAAFRCKLQPPKQRQSKKDAQSTLFFSL